MYFQKRVIFNTEWCEKQVWGSSLRLEMSWATRGMILLQNTFPVFLPHQLVLDGASWGVYSVPKPVRRQFGFHWWINFQLGALKEKVKAEVVRGSCGLVFQTCVLSVWSLILLSLEWIPSSPSSDLMSLRGREATSIMERLGNVESAQWHLE